MRILQVLLSPRVGGAETLVASLEDEFASRGHETLTVYLDDDKQGRSRFGRVVGRWVRLASATRRFKPDLVLAHSALPSVYARLQANAKRRCVPVLHSAGDDYAAGPLRLLERLLQRRAPAMVAVSPTQAAVYRAHFPRSSRVVVIPNGVRDDLPRKGTYSVAATNVVAMARVAHQKDPKTWVRAAEIIRTHDDQIRFTWWGPAADGFELDEIQGSLSSDIQFAGSSNSPGEVLEAADVLFHSAVSEAQSIGLLEAASIGIPIVCSLRVSETLPASVPRTTFAGGDAESAAAALLAVLAHYPDRCEDARLAAPVVRKNFSISRTTDAYENLLSEVSGAPQ